MNIKKKIGKSGKPNSMPFLVFRRGSFAVHIGIICGSGSFAVQFGDHFQSGDHLRSGIICGTVQFPSKFKILFSKLEKNICWSARVTPVLH